MHTHYSKHTHTRTHKLQSFTGDGLYEVLVETGAKRLYFPASLGKILA